MYTKDQLELAKMNGTYDRIYGDAVNEKVRAKYTLSDELAVLRKKDDEPEEYAAYYAFVEECKQAVKAEMEAT